MKIAQRVRPLSRGNDDFGYCFVGSFLVDRAKIERHFDKFHGWTIA